MRSSTFYRIILFLPYLTLIPGYLLARDFSVSESALFSAQGLGMSWMVLAGFWLIPYTIMVIGLLIWSRRKSSNLIRSWLLRSPFILMIVMPLVFILLGWLGSYSSDPNISSFLAGVGLLGPICSAPVGLVIGYIFVLIGLMLYEILHRFGYIKDEAQ